MPDDAVPFAAMTSRTHLAWSIGTVLATAGAVSFVVATQPQNRAYAWLFVPVVLVLVVTVWVSYSVDPVAGVVERRRCRVWRRRVTLVPTTGVALVGNRVGGLLLVLRPTGERPVHVPLLALTPHVERAQPAEVLEVLAGALERHGTGGSRPVVLALRAQAAHLEAGGSARSSPLAASVS
ncbi:hypothetical protein [Cellulomonas sp. URHD0024]|uniref:hypothetical protein n=1 Tax=Cellulomonas sp. URHD0024 TaxID=1302620 RepID=UPI0003F6E306|nr:hypothetical protein [Cellulomonas sp. URHD0024]